MNGCPQKPAVDLFMSAQFYNDNEFVSVFCLTYVKLSLYKLDF